MGDILNNLTPLELAEIRERLLNKREDRHCLWCEKVANMRRDQKFCKPACRAAYSYHVAQAAADNLAISRARWEKEKAELLHEISELRKGQSPSPSS